MAIQTTLQFGIVFAIVAVGIASRSTLAELNAGSSYSSLPSDDYFIARGHSAKLECDVGAFWQQSSLLSQPSQAAAAAEARWSLNGIALKKDDGRWKIYKNGTLVIPKFGKRLNGNSSLAANVGNFEGFYQCLTENQTFGVLLARTIHLRIAYLKEFLRQPEDLHARESQPVIIPCSINSLPKAAVFWERDDKPLPQNKKYVPLPSGSLLITNVHSSDVGSYRCKVVNIILKKTKKSKSGYLSIVSRPIANDRDESSIIPLDLGSNVTAHVGEDVSFYCIVNFNQITTIRWLNAKYAVVSNSSIFTMRNVTLSQSGEYTCSVIGSYGNHKKVYFLTVVQSPVFNSTPTSGVHTLASTIRLNCTATGWPPPTIKWLKNGRLFNIQAHIRAKHEHWGLLISLSTASDSGIYQCLATNPAGSVWSGASIRLNSTNSPSEARDIQCLPYREDSVCLRWKGEPNMQGYAIMAHKTGSEYSDSKWSKDYLTKETFRFVDNLQTNTNYTFFIRTFSQKASTEFANVTCRTGISGVRNLTAHLESPTAMLLSWAPVSSDYNPCNEHKSQKYKMQWHRASSEGVNSIEVVGFETTLSGFTPGAKYEFLVRPSAAKTSFDSLTFTLPQVDDLQHGNSLESVLFNETDTDRVLLPPLQLDAFVVSTNSINVSWSDQNPLKAQYKVCYMVQNESKSCDVHGKFIEHFSGKSVLIEQLLPKTEYEIRVRASYQEQTTPFSHSLLITTPSDVPSEVQGLEYKILSRTSACVKWEPPSHSNGRITKYSIIHAANLSWPAEKWLRSSILMPRNNDGCWDYDAEGIIVSTVLHDLDPDLLYNVNVVAVNDAGSGTPTIPLTISTKFPFHAGIGDQEEPVNQEDLYYRQGIGVALGFGIALLFILTCVCGFFTQKYLRRRLRTQRRFPHNDNYTTRVNPNPKQNGQCINHNNEHELQQLVETNGHSHIPPLPLPATTLDTKGGAEYPNGVYLNGHATNLRITENPQYCKKLEVNPGDDNQLTREYEEDTNSNLQKVKEFPFPKTNGQHDQHDNVADDNDNSTLNSTQITILDDSVSSASNAHLRQSTLDNG